ncbi:hypothetical protein [Alienimonas sp. DA493]|uniref:hypothetical protein n=1 Tax=Alienimonas sp. DA493 TaxID=3373605 RepID=UPI003754D47C
MATTPSGEYALPRQDIRDALEEFDLAADRAGFVGLKIAPALEVGEVNGVYDVVPIESMLREYDTRRAPDGNYPRTDGKVEQASYVTKEHGIEERVDDRLARAHASRFDSELLAAERCRDAVMRGHERRVITAATGLAAGQQTAAGSNGGAWSTGTSDPFTLVHAARKAVRNRVGRAPNAMVLDWEAFEVLVGLDAVIDRIKYSGYTDPSKAALQPQVIAQALGLDEIIVANSVTNGANMAEEASIESMWPRATALLFVRYDGPDTRKPQFMRTFHWGADGSQIGGVFEEYRDEARRSDIIRNRMDSSEDIVYGAAGQLLTGLLA